MRDCDHAGHTVYTRRTFRNGTVHICVQCQLCLSVVKLPEHGFRPYINLSEVPTGAVIVEFCDSDGTP